MAARAPFFDRDSSHSMEEHEFGGLGGGLLSGNYSFFSIATASWYLHYYYFKFTHYLQMYF